MEIMKLFKKALVATAIFGAMGAQAADVSDATKLTSKEGFAAGIFKDITNTDPSVRVIVRQKLEAGDRIKLVFGAGLDLDKLTSNTPVKLFNNNASGSADIKAYVPGAGDDTDVLGNELGINTGSGTYELELVPSLSDYANNVVVLEVKTGFTIEQDESFEIIPDVTLFTDKATTENATVTYSATSWKDGSAKDTIGDNTGSFLKLASQYSASVSKKLDGIIEREDQVKFISGEVSSNNNADTLEITIKDQQSYIAAVKGGNVTATFELTGDYENLVLGSFTPVAVAASGNITTSTVTPTLDSTSKLSITVTDAGDQDTGNGIAGKLQLTIDNDQRTNNDKKIKATDFTVYGEVDYDAAVGTKAETIILASNTDAGEWMLDATIINIPYFPVGFEGVNTQVNFANESGVAVDVNVTAIDAKGNQYTGSLADLAKYSTTKVSQVTLMSALKDNKTGNTVPAGSKLSVTFNIDADDGKVNAYAFSEKVGQGRQSLVTSQQKGIKDVVIQQVQQP
jgi:hypothetical protein